MRLASAAAITLLVMGGLAALPAAHAASQEYEPWYLYSMDRWRVTGQGAYVSMADGYSGYGLAIAPPASQAGPTTLERDISVGTFNAVMEASQMFRTPPAGGTQPQVATMSIRHASGETATIRLHDLGRYVHYPVRHQWYVEVSNGYWSASSGTFLLEANAWHKMVLLVKPGAGIYEAKVTHGSSSYNPTSVVTIPLYGSGTLDRVAISAEGSDRPFHFDELWVKALCNTPLDPRQVTAESGSTPGRIAVRWIDAPSASCASTRFDIERSPSPSGPWTHAGSVAGWTRFLDEGLPPGATYHYRVKTFNDAGESQWSPVTNAATTPNVPSAPPVTARGGREGQLDGPRADQIELTWGQAADRGNRIQGYKVYSAASPTGPFSDRGWKESPFLDRDLAPGQTVHYRVVAVNEVGEGVPGTATASADTYSVPSEPRNLVAASQAGETRLVWQEPAYVGPIILGNQVYRGFEDGPLALLAEVGPEPTYSDTTCPLGRVCTYEVRATNRAGTGPASAQAQAFGTALPPDSPVLTPLYESAVDPDQDGHATPDELLGNSNPLLGGSHPDEDSNCDGTDNREEGSFLAAHGIGHRALRVTPGEGVRVHPEAMDHGGDLVVVDVATVTPYTEEGQECT